MSNYTNKELAAQCLIEAAELLNESGGRNSAFDKYMNIKQGKKNPDDTSTKKEGRSLAKDAAELRDKKYGIFEKGKKKRDIETHRENIRDAQEYAERNRNALDGIRADHNNLTPKQRDLNRIINSNGTKSSSMSQRKARLQSRNESVDISSLLREAADLLED